MDEIAAALGHSSPTITARHYIHHVRKRFSPLLAPSLGLDGAPDATVIPMAGHSRVTEATTAAKGSEHAA